VSPGYVLGGMGAARSLEERQRIRELTPLGHVQRVQDLLGPLVFLASKAADYVTGQNLVVDGGHTLSAWLSPPERSVPPRVDPAAECLDLNAELDERGIAHDDNGIITE
jgi:Enoyl-(Acyl carrier protein) reductase